MSIHHIDLNKDASKIKDLRVGELVTLSGLIHVTIGIPVHKHLINSLSDRESPILEKMRGGCFFHLSTYVDEGPLGMKPLYINPSTSTRYNEWMPSLIEGFQLKMVGGKGGLDEHSVQAIRENGSVYLSFLGGGSPMLSKGLKRVVDSNWNNYISQFRLLTLEVEQFGPATVAIDAMGHSIYEDLKLSAGLKFDAIVEELNTQRSEFIKKSNSEGLGT